MKPVFQKVIDDKRGDCLAACLASILELPLEAVPDFDKLKIGHAHGHWGTVGDWLNTRGYALAWIQKGFAYCLRGVPIIAHVPSQSFPGVGHAVVACYRSDTKDERTVRLEILHDPNPKNKPYEKLEVFDIMVLVPLEYGREKGEDGKSHRCPLCRGFGTVPGSATFQTYSCTHCGGTGTVSTPEGVGLTGADLAGCWPDND